MKKLDRLWAVLSRRRSDSDLRDELAFHLEHEVQQNIAAGMPPDEARRQALIVFGGVQQTRERVSEAHWMHALGTFLQDVRFGARMLRRSPGFTLVAITTLALGIGANTAVFSNADALLLRPLPFPQLDQLVTVFPQYGNGALGRRMAPADFRDYQQQNKSFKNLSAYSSKDFNVTGNSAPEKVSGAEVSANFFETAGMNAILGRTFAPNEEMPGQTNVAVISYGLWLRRFGADPKVIGHYIELNGTKYTILGVMDKAMMFPGGADLWVPIAWTQTRIADRKSSSFEVIGRLRPGTSLAMAKAEMKTRARELALQYPTTNKDLSVQLRSLRLVVNGTMMLPAMETLFLTALLVLLLACVNVANLQLSRGTVRIREMAVRAAIGARRARLVRQLLVESALLAALGSIAACLLARWVISLQVASMPPILFRIASGLNEMRVDERAMVFTLGVCLFTVLASGILPALSGTKLDLISGLKEGGKNFSGGSRHRLRNVLVAAQIALAVALLGGTILGVRGFQQMAETSRSFSSERVLTFAVTLPENKYSTPGSKAAFYQEAIEKLSAMPGVQSAAIFTTTPLSNNGVIWMGFQTEEQTDAKRKNLPGGIIHRVSPDYFDTLHIPVVAGRRFTRADQAGSPEVAIINQRLARRFFPNGALGRRIKIFRQDHESGWMEIVGIAGDVLYDWTNEIPEFTVYRPYPQAPPQTTLFAMRAAVNPLSLSPNLRQGMAQLDPDLPVYDVKTLAQAISEGVISLKLTGSFTAALGLIALLLAGVGIYGVMACSVAERRQEIGIRMALGADKGNVVFMILRRGLLLTGVGTGAGIPLAVGLTRSLASISYGANQGDPVIIGWSAAILALVALVACFLPARRATKVDPLVALRYE